MKKVYHFILVVKNTEFLSDCTKNKIVELNAIVCVQNNNFSFKTIVIT